MECTATTTRLRQQLTKILKNQEEQEFRRIRDQFATSEVLYAVDLVCDALAYANEHRDRRSRANNIAVRSIASNITFCFHRLDAIGANKFLCKVGPKFLEFSFADLVRVLEPEIRLAHRTSFFPEEFSQIMQNFEKGKKEVSGAWQRGTFQFSELSLPSIPGYLGPGASWYHWVEGIVGGVITVVNAAGAIPTAGIAIASVAVGVAGVTAAVCGYP